MEEVIKGTVFGIAFLHVQCVFCHHVVLCCDWSVICPSKVIGQILQLIPTDLYWLGNHK